MPTFIDCPSCASEIMVSQETSEDNIRCPDCLQWIEEEYDDAYTMKTYYGASKQLVSANDFYDEDDYGYDY